MSSRKNRGLFVCRQPRAERQLVALALALALLLPFAAAGQRLLDDGRNFDARYDASLKVRREVAAPAWQRLALERLGAGLSYRLETLTGVTTSLSRVGGALSPTLAGDPADASVSFVRTNAQALGLRAADLDEVEVTDVVESRLTGGTHVYLRQRFAGRAVYGAQLQLYLDAEQRVVAINNAMMPEIAAAATAVTAAPVLSAADAVVVAARHAGLELRGVPAKGSEDLASPSRRTVLYQPDISGDEIDAGLMWLPIRRGELALIWNFRLRTPDGDHWYDLTVDAMTGKPWTRLDWVASDSYRVYADPCEDPSDCGRTLIADPADPIASPDGWHTRDEMDGNNVHAYDDANSTNTPPANEPTCGAGRDCDFPINLTQQPVNYRDAAIANLFYWNNRIHDIHYQYGFDEPAGNFQDDNFGRGGLGNDSVQAEAQDGSGLNNANFATPLDGNRPRMQMFLWNRTNPQRDGDLDNGIIAHEYGHGVSFRQIGGPNTNCLGGQQQFGEGHSDWMALVYTARASHTATTPRGVGGYADNSNGIRPAPYTTDRSVNDATYESIRGGVTIPHGVGWVWNSILWEVYWRLVNKHGFSANLANPGSFAAGNQRAILYVNQGLQFTDCGGNTVDFLDGRDGIVQAAGQLFGGEDVCDIWEGFASRGLGFDAATDGTNASATNGFTVPPECQGLVASVECDIDPGRRGVCTAHPQGPGFTYVFEAFGGVHVGGGRPTHHSRSATCSSIGSVRVTVTDDGGESASARTTVRCEGGRR